MNSDQTAPLGQSDLGPSFIHAITNGPKSVRLTKILSEI